jgi:hypothetical protein
MISSGEAKLDRPLSASLLGAVLITAERVKDTSAAEGYRDIARKWRELADQATAGS